jgi:hypothetical protein
MRWHRRGSCPRAFAAPHPPPDAGACNQLHQLQGELVGDELVMGKLGRWRTGCASRHESHRQAGLCSSANAPEPGARELVLVRTRPPSRPRSRAHQPLPRPNPARSPIKARVAVGATPGWRGYGDNQQHVTRAPGADRCHPARHVDVHAQAQGRKPVRARVFVRRPNADRAPRCEGPSGFSKSGGSRAGHKRARRMG